MRWLGHVNRPLAKISPKGPFGLTFGPAMA